MRSQKIVDTGPEILHLRLDLLIDGLAEGRLNVWEMHRSGEDLNYSPEVVMPEMKKAFVARQPALLEGLLHLAQIAPSSVYTPILCEIVEDIDSPWGATEAALDALEASMDPASFDALARVASRSGLSQDPTDWRKALAILVGFARRGLVPASKVERALDRIERSGNMLAELAREAKPGLSGNA
jgi:hypothetical protein